MVCWNNLSWSFTQQFGPLAILQKYTCYVPMEVSDKMVGMAATQGADTIYSVRIRHTMAYGGFSCSVGHFVLGGIQYCQYAQWMFLVRTYTHIHLHIKQ